MAMHNRFNSRSLFVDLQVQQGFAAALLVTRDLLAGHVDDADVLWLKKTFGMHRGRAQYFVVADANRDIPIVGSRKAFVVYATPYLADVLLDLVCIDHFFIS